MNLKTFVILLVLLTVLFVVGIGAGIGRDDRSDAGDFSVWRKRMDSFGALIPRGVVSWDDVNRSDPLSCLDSAESRIVLPANSRCTLILEPNGRARDLNVTLLVGEEANVILIQPLDKSGKSLTAHKKIGVGKSAELDLFSRQTNEDRIELQIDCLNTVSAECQLTLGDQR